MGREAARSGVLRPGSSVPIRGELAAVCNHGSIQGDESRDEVAMAVNYGLLSPTSDWGNEIARCGTAVWRHVWFVAPQYGDATDETTTGAFPAA